MPDRAYGAVGNAEALVGNLRPESDAALDGVSVSDDEVNLYEFQDLRHSRSDRFTAYDTDLDAAIATLDSKCTSNFRIRFLQYDNNPVPTHGVSLTGIRLEGDLRPAILYLPTNDEAANSTVTDAAAGGHDQTFTDPGGNPNTDAHSVTGAVGMALSFDVVEDRIHQTVKGYRLVLEADQDFSIAFWWQADSPDAAATLHFFSNRIDTERSLFAYTFDGRVFMCCRFVTGEIRWLSHHWVDGTDDMWRHYVLTRDGGLDRTDNQPETASKYLSLALIVAYFTWVTPSVGG